MLAQSSAHNTRAAAAKTSTEIFDMMLKVSKGRERGRMREERARGRMKEGRGGTEKIRRREKEEKKSNVAPMHVFHLFSLFFSEQESRRSKQQSHQQ